MARIYLGGNPNGTNWKSDLIPKLTIKHFDPGGHEQETVNKEKAACDIHLYVISPYDIDPRDIVELMQSLACKEVKVIMHIFPYGFTSEQITSLLGVKETAEAAGATVNMEQGLSATEIAIGSLL